MFVIVALGLRIQNIAFFFSFFLLGTSFTLNAVI